MNIISSKNLKSGMYVISSSHGVGLVERNEEEFLMGRKERCFTVRFERDNVSLIVPESKMESMNIRHLISKKVINDIYAILKESSRGLKIIWSKKSQEYNKMIKSGDIFENAKVVRDLYRNTTNPNRSYTERKIYEVALKNIVMELALVCSKTEEQMEKEILKILAAYHETYEDEHGNQDLDSKAA